jgi:hypothetical protein
MYKKMKPKFNFKIKPILFLISLIISSSLYAQDNPFMAINDSLLKDDMNMLIQADLNNDGWKDILGISSITHCCGDSIYLYQNLGDNKFDLINSLITKRLFHPIANCADFDNNGFLDIIISGNTKGDESPDYKTYLFKNNGNWSFSEVAAENITGLVYGNISVVDFNNDGKTDLLMCGQDNGGKVFSNLYKNTGGFVFSSVPNPFKSLRNGTSFWADYDNDGFSDLLMAGEYVSPDYNLTSSAVVYKNNKNGTFTFQKKIILEGIAYGKAKWGDYDNDGDLDILISGGTSGIGTIKLFNNDGNGNFIKVDLLGIEPLGYSTTEWEDFDNDGDLDLFYSGLRWTEGELKWDPKTSIFMFDQIYHENSMQTDSIVDIKSFISDMDSDGDLDIAYSGYVQPYALKTRVLINNSIPNTAPSVPSMLSSVQKANKIILNWNKSSDAETNSNTLTYSLKIGTQPGGFDIFSPEAIVEDGKRLKNEPGLINQIDSGYIVQNLAPGKYYWSVQAIDGAYMASSFAPEDSFTVEAVFLQPNCPVDLNAQIVSENRIDLTWSYSNNDETGFLIERAADSTLNFQVIDTVGSSVYSFMDKNLHPETMYYYRIKTIVNTLMSDYSDTISKKTWTMPLLSKVFDNEIVKDKLSTTGASWGDFNNDGWIDLCTVNRFGPIQIFKNNSDETFSLIELPNSGNAKGVNWIDINNDGYLDLFIVQGYFYPNLIYLNNQNETFTAITNSNLTVDMGETVAAAWADYDKDGLVDVFICNVDSSNSLYRNKGDYQFELIDFGVNDPSGKNTCGCNWVDYDNDGDLDLFVVNYYFENFLYSNNGDGTFKKITSGEIVTRSEPTVSASWGDFDSDGDLDMIAANNCNTDNSFYINNGNGKLTRTGVWPFANRGGVLGSGNAASWEDIDNDGDLDLFIAHQYNNQMYLNSGNNEFIKMTDEPAIRDYGSSSAALWADYNNDGNLDLFIPNDNGQANYLYKNNGFPFPDSLKSATITNNRVLIKLEGKTSNSFGLGAKIMVESNGHSTERYITTQSGSIGSTNNLIASVGIGDNTSAKLVITWPSGIIQMVSTSIVNNVFVIEEPNLSSTASPIGMNVFPNPAKSVLYVKLESSDNIKYIGINNLSGQLIYHANVENMGKSDFFSMDIKDIQPGIYILTVEGLKGKLQKKFCIVN